MKAKQALVWGLSLLTTAAPPLHAEDTTSPTTLVRPKFVVPALPSPSLPPPKLAPGASPHPSSLPFFRIPEHEPITFDQSKGLVVINGTHILQKDSYIFADTVLIYGQLVTLQHNLTIIARQILFAERLPFQQFAGIPEPFRLQPALETSKPHIFGVMGNTASKRGTEEQNLMLGKITLFAGAIYGRPIIHHTRVIYKKDNPEADGVSSVDIQYGESEFPLEQKPFAGVIVGHLPRYQAQLHIAASLAPLQKKWHQKQRQISILMTELRLQKQLQAAESIPANAAQMLPYLDKTIQDQSQDLRAQSLGHDSEYQDLVLGISREHADEIFHLFVPDDIDVTRLKKEIDLDAPDSDSPKIDSQKWSMDLVTISPREYHTGTK